MQQRQQQQHARIARNNYRPTLRPQHTHARCEDCGAVLPTTAQLPRAFLAPGSPGERWLPCRVVANAGHTRDASPSL
eukprot:3070298-Lingulodinium_polyedra.AAC.1